MSIARPIFADGSILAANDLSTLESVSRDRDARHARHLHTPGVGAGLTLKEEPRTTGSGVAYVEISLLAGYAVDGTGRELVVASDMPLSPDRFGAETLNPTLEPGETFTVWHPVFIRGQDTPVSTATQDFGCQGRGAGRVAEDVEIEFGRPGDASASQSAPAPDAGPGDGGWLVLVGFVRYDTAIGKFTKSALSADGVAVTGVGARAGLVAGLSGKVELRGRAATDAGVPVLMIDSAAGPSLVFGTHTGSGTVSPLLTIDASGNLEVQGAVTSKGAAGSVTAAAGTVTDGAVIPLPTGVDQATVDSGGIELTVYVTPHLPEPGTGPTANHLFVPGVCRVDSDRRAQCTGNWFNPTAVGPSTSTAISCDYLVLAVVPGGP